MQCFFAVKYKIIDMEAIRLTSDEFEALLFEIYKRGFNMGVYRKSNNIDSPAPYESALKEKFDLLMYEMGLKTEGK